MKGIGRAFAIAAGTAAVLLLQGCMQVPTASKDAAPREIEFRTELPKSTARTPKPALPYRYLPSAEALAAGVQAADEDRVVDKSAAHYR